MAAVTLISTPDPFALTKGGRMLYQFEGSGRMQTTGLKAVGLLLLVNPIADGTLLVLRWNGLVYTLKFKTNPSAADEFTAGNGSAAYADALMAELQAYYPIREAFTLSRNAPDQLPGINFTAKQPGTQFNVTVDLPLGTPFGWGTTIVGANALIRVKYSIYVEVWVQNPGTDGSDVFAHYSRAFRTPIETNTNGAAQFDVGSILHSLLSADWPRWNLDIPTGAYSSHRKYFVVYGEAFGSPLQIGKIFQDQVRHAYLGGADFTNRSGSGYALSRYADSGSANKALRFGSQTRYVLPGEPQYLTFLNQENAALTPLTVQAVLTFQDGGTLTVNDLFAPQTLPVGEKITYPVGAGQLDLLTRVPAGKTLQAYSLKLLVDGDDWSLSYRYILNANYQPYTRFFAYLSSLGVVETLTTFGKGSSELSLFSEQAERYLPAHYELQDGQFVNYNTSIQQQVTVATGFWPEAVLQTWNDFYRSPNRFRLKDGLAFPIGIVSKSIKQAKDGDNLRAHSFEYAYLYQDDFYTGKETDEIGDGNPPMGFTPVGQITIQQVQIVNSVDATISDAVRELTTNDISSFRVAAARPNPQTLGFLTQESGSALFRRKDQPVNYLTDLANVPTMPEILASLSALAPNLRYRLGLPIVSADSQFSSEFNPSEFQ